MPGDYGPGGKWIHDRAHRIMREGDTKDEYGSKKGKSIAYAIATQQAHSLGKSPKDFRTPSGVHEAKMKYDEPKKEYQKTAMLTGFFDEIDKIARVNPGALREAAEQAIKRAAQHRKKGKEKGSQGMGMDAGAGAAGGPAGMAASAPPPPSPAPMAGGGMGGGMAGGMM